jgi:hypothetical protein
MTLWLILFVVWLAGIPAMALLLSVLSMRYDDLRPGRSPARPRLYPLSAPLAATRTRDCTRRLHRSARGRLASARRTSPRRWR